jgi:hypothetical protein
VDINFVCAVCVSVSRSNVSMDLPMPDLPGFVVAFKFCVCSVMCACCIACVNTCTNVFMCFDEPLPPILASKRDVYYVCMHVCMHACMYVCVLFSMCICSVVFI